MAIALDDIAPNQPARRLPAPGKQEPWRDGNGAYRFTRATDGKLRSYTRVSTIADILADKLQLHQWEERMTIQGLMTRPDLQALAAGLDKDDDRHAFNTLVSDCKAAAKSHEAANLGTALHRFTELWDNGAQRLDEYPERWRPHLTAYAAALEQHNLTVDPDLIETVVINDSYGYGGTIDRAVTANKQITAKLPGGKTKRIKKGQRIIGDLKTGGMQEYKWIQMATQLSAYAHHEATWHVDHSQDHGGQRGDKLDIRTDIAAIIHLPATDPEPTCTIHWIDLDRAIEYFETSLAVRALRSAPTVRQLMSVYGHTKPEYPKATPAADPRLQLSAQLAIIKQHPAALAAMQTLWPDSMRVNGRPKLPDDPDDGQVALLLNVADTVASNYELPL